jgi:capsule polysaccharide export protein KpsE/RkpR
LNTVKQEPETAEKDFSRFFSKNAKLGVDVNGRAMVEEVVALQGKLIAVESELEGLGQVCTDNNSVKARIEGLKHQLEKLGGKGEGATSISDQASDFIYPPIRELPRLGVIYTDLHRGTTIQETVLETFTREYNLVKIQEAKEIPRVKTLDTANIPDKKSFSSRLLFTIGVLCLLWK